MSVIGRLWRRAPAWRLCVVAALAFTGLAVMFPPSLPHLPPLIWPHGTRASGTGAHYHAEQSVGPPQNGVSDMPAVGAGREGIIPFAGRQLPLPTGSWHEMAVARDENAKVQLSLLNRIEGGRLTGLILVSAPQPQIGAVGSVDLPAPCFDPDAIDHHITPPVAGKSPFSHECWSLTVIDMRAATASKDPGNLVARDLGRLGDLGIGVSASMLRLTYARSGATGWRIANIFLPGGVDTARSVALWAARFQGAMHKGYDRTLTAADLPPSVARDPS